MMQWIRSSDPTCPWDASCTHIAASQGYLTMLKWMKAADPPCPWDARCTTMAMSPGNEEMLQWLRLEAIPPCPWDESCMKTAVGYAHNHALLPWMLTQEPPPPWHSSCSVAIAHFGRLDLLQWLHHRGYGLATDLALIAASQGHVRMLQWLLDVGKTLPDVADEAGRLFEIPPRCCNSRATACMACRVRDAYRCDDPEWPVSTLMLCGDRDMKLSACRARQLHEARIRFCTLHGLIRWFCRSFRSRHSSSCIGSCTDSQGGSSGSGLASHVPEPGTDAQASSSSSSSSPSSHNSSLTDICNGIIDEAKMPCETASPSQFNGSSSSSYNSRRNVISIVRTANITECASMHPVKGSHGLGYPLHAQAGVDKQNGQSLLFHLAQLPDELIAKIAEAADLQ